MSDLSEKLTVYIATFKNMPKEKIKDSIILFWESHTNNHDDKVKTDATINLLDATFDMDACEKYEVRTGFLSRYNYLPKPRAECNLEDFEEAVIKGENEEKEWLLRCKPDLKDFELCNWQQCVNEKKNYKFKECHEILKSKIINDERFQNVYNQSVIDYVNKRGANHSNSLEYLTEENAWILSLPFLYPNKKIYIVHVGNVTESTLILFDEFEYLRNSTRLILPDFTREYFNNNLDMHSKLQLKPHIGYAVYRRANDNSQDQKNSLKSSDTELLKKIESLEVENEMLHRVIDHIPGDFYWVNRSNMYIGSNNEHANKVNLNDKTIVGKFNKNIDLLKQKSRSDTDVNNSSFDENTCTSNNIINLHNGALKDPANEDSNNFLNNTILNVFKNTNTSSNDVVSNYILDNDAIHNRVMDSDKLYDFKENIIENGVEKILHIKKIPILNDNKSVIGLLSIANDITEMKNQHEHELKRMVDLTKGNENDKFHNIIQHFVYNLRQITSTILMIIEMNVHDKKDSNVCLHAIKEIEYLIDSIISICCINETKNNDIFDFYITLKSAVDRIQKNKNNSHYKINIKKCEDGFCLVKGNQAEFQKMIINLINNSFESFKKQDSYVNIETQILDNKVQFIVDDNGCGMDKNILDEMNNGNFIRSTKNKQYGVGIIQVKNTLQSIGGSMSVSSDVNHGTRITITIPTHQDRQHSKILSNSVSLNSNVLFLNYSTDTKLHGILSRKIGKLLQKKLFIDYEKALEFIHAYNVIDNNLHQSIAYAVNNNTPGDAGDIFVKDSNNMYFLIDIDNVDFETVSKTISKFNHCVQFCLLSNKYNNHDLISLADKYALQIIPKQIIEDVCFSIAC